MILLYKGKSFISKLIKWQTFGQYSHAAWWCQDGTVIEAWQKDGVQRNDSPATIHIPGTEIDVFAVPGIDEAAVEQFLISQLGKGYDFSAVLRGFTFRLDRDDPDKWFCSELIHRACREGLKALLERIIDARVHPTLLSFSPLIEKVGTITTRDNVDFDFKTLDASNPPDTSE